MKLRSKFEVTRGGLQNRNPVSFLHVYVGELLSEEQRLATQSIIRASHVLLEAVNVAYDAQGKNKGNRQIQCYSFKEFGHIAHSMVKNFTITLSKLYTLLRISYTS